MQAKEISNRQQIALRVLSGVGMFFLTSFVYASVASFDPFYYLAGGSRSLAKVAAFSYIVVVLGYWSALWRSLLLGIRETAEVVVPLLASFGLTALLAAILGIDTDEFLLGYVAWTSRWLGPAIAIASLPLGYRFLRLPVTGKWRPWAAAGLIAFAVGLMLYYLGGRYSRVLLLMKVSLILIWPSACALAIALRSGAGVSFRIVAALVGLIGIVQATLR